MIPEKDIVDDRLKAKQESLDGSCVHVYEIQPYLLTSNPPQSVSICLKCGKKLTRFVI